MPAPALTAVQAPPAATAPLDFDTRLALAALAVDARIHTEPLDLADVIRLPHRDAGPPARSLPLPHARRRLPPPGRRPHHPRLVHRPDARRERRHVPPRSNPRRS
ncbi:hypothetical protein LUW77_03405 [Streptomyces radiopugnans]|nr:hypothetical protein LUW77_03405 [Streptomyces radiopugnans]